MIRKWSEKKIAELIKEGRGDYVDGHYVPWISALDFSSMGVSHRMLSKKTGRKHDLLSSEEYAFFLRAEWSPNVVDIQEQYPLDRQLTKTLADELKVNHPCYPKTHIPIVMTCDFLLTLSDGENLKRVAIDVKTSADVGNPRTLEKLEVTRNYFQALDIKHHVMLDRRMDGNTTRNLNWLFMEQRKASVEEHVETEPLQHDMLAWLESLDSRGRNLKLRELGQHFDDYAGQRRGTGLAVMRYLMLQRAIPVVLTSNDLANVRWSELMSMQDADIPMPKAA